MQPRTHEPENQSWGQTKPGIEVVLYERDEIDLKWSWIGSVKTILCSYTVQSTSSILKFDLDHDYLMYSERKDYPLIKSWQITP